MINEKIYRIIDANLNRSAEGLRVIEDLMRFAFNRPDLSASVRNLRHEIRKASGSMFDSGILSRDSQNDPGLAVSQASKNDDKASIRDLVIGNFKRVQEGLRSLEENSKVAGHYEVSKVFESCRYESYTLEKKMMELIIAESRRSILDTDIYCITAHEHSNGRSNTEVVKELLESGIKLVQYREKDKTLRQKFYECKEIRQMTRDFGARFIVNDDIELAVMVGADGVHIGQDDFPVSEVRKIVGDGVAIGLSTHSPEQAVEAVKAGVDYIGVGPIFKTYTKKDVVDPVGFDYLEYVACNIKIPFVAIGGIKAHNLGDVVKKGASCVALVTEIVGAESIGKKIAELREIINQAKGLNI